VCTIPSRVASALCEIYDNADTIMDRLIANAHRLELKGKSMRKRKKDYLKLLKDTAYEPEISYLKVLVVQSLKVLNLRVLGK